MVVYLTPLASIGFLMAVILGLAAVLQVAIAALWHSTPKRVRRHRGFSRAHNPPRDTEQ